MSDLNVYSKMYVDDPMVYSNRLFEEGLSFTEKCEYENALSVFEQYRRYHPGDPKVYFEMARCMLILERNDEVLKLIDRAIILDPEYGEAIGLKGYYLRFEESKDVLIYFHFGNSLAPKTDFIIEGLYLSYVELGNYKSAVMYLEQLIEIKPEYLNYQYNLAMLYQDLGQLDKAMIVMAKVVSQMPDETTFTEYLDELKQERGKNTDNSYMGMNN